MQETASPSPLSGDPTAPGCNYQGSYGSNMEYNATIMGSPPNGVFQYSTGQVIGLQAITDGTPNTAAYGECLVGTGNTGGIDPRRDLIFFGQYPAGMTRNVNMNPAANSGGLHELAPGLLRVSDDCQLDEGPCRIHGRKLGLRHRGLHRFLVHQSAQLPVWSMQRQWDRGVSQNPGAVGMSSNHPGGANMLLCDGSVRFLKNSASFPTVWALGSRRGEVVSSDSY